MSIEFILLLSGVSLLSAHSLKSLENYGRIFGASDIEIEEVPCQVSVQENGEHVCGGSIYKRNAVITAAHCVFGQKVDDLSVRVGSKFWNSGGTVIRVSRFITHEEYSNETAINDVAILILSAKITLSDKAQKIPLARNLPPVGAKATVSGWGSTETKNISEILLSAEVNIVDFDECNIAYEDDLAEDVICAAAPGKDACYQDSGGPLVYKGELVGIVSFGGECADPRFPGVYANVHEFYQWIGYTASRSYGKI